MLGPLQARLRRFGYRVRTDRHRDAVTRLAERYARHATIRHRPHQQACRAVGECRLAGNQAERASRTLRRPIREWRARRVLCRFLMSPVMITVESVRRGLIVGREVGTAADGSARGSPDPSTTRDLLDGTRVASGWCNHRGWTMQDATGQSAGKVVPVTSGNAAIGRATPIAFAKQRAQVVIGGRRETDGEAVIPEIKDDRVARRSSSRPTCLKRATSAR